MMIDTAVIPCGGLGTRLHPITRWLPKEMLPVGLKPVLYWTLDEAAGAGLLRAIIITNPHKPMLEAVARNYQGPLELEFVAQDHPVGLAMRCSARGTISPDLLSWRFSPITCFTAPTRPRPFYRPSVQPA